MLRNLSENFELNYPELYLATPRIVRLHDAFSRILELEASPLEGQPLQQKDKKRKKSKAKKQKTKSHKT